VPIDCSQLPTKHSTQLYSKISLTVKPSIKTAIQYDPRHRGLRLALAYRRFPRKADRQAHDLYGFAVGYGGGGCDEELYFHVEERREEGFVSLTQGYRDEGWVKDLIGSSGLAPKPLPEQVTRVTPFSHGINDIFDSVHDYLYRRRLTWGEDDWPDLRRSAKSRLNCERRRAFYLSPGFDENLLAFISPKWAISLSFGPEAEAFERHHQEFLARIRAKQ